MISFAHLSHRRIVGIAVGAAIVTGGVLAATWHPAPRAEPRTTADVARAFAASTSPSAPVPTTAASGASMERAELTASLASTVTRAGTPTVAPRPPSAPAAPATVTISGPVSYSLFVDAVYLSKGFQMACDAVLGGVNIETSSGKVLAVSATTPVTKSQATDSTGNGSWRCEEDYTVTVPRAASYVVAWTNPQIPELNTGCRDTKNSHVTATDNGTRSLTMPLMSYNFSCAGGQLP